MFSVILLPALLVLAGCTTPGKVRTMIEENNQRLAAEQLKPEFDRVDALISETAQELAETGDAITTLKIAFEAERQSVAEKISALDSETKAALEEEKKQTAAKIQNLSLALNKTQGDLGIMQEKINEMQGIFSSQQKEIDTIRNLVDTQKDALLSIFRKQQEELARVIETLEAYQKDGSIELTAPSTTVEE